MTAQPPTIRELIAGFPAWLKANIKTAIFSAAIGAVVGWVSNVYLMAVTHEGYDVPAGSAATGRSNLVAGAVFWGVASMVVFGIAGYWRAVGTKRFFEDMKNLPSRIGETLREDGDAAKVHLLWGAAVSLAASLVVSASTGAMLAIGLLAFMPSFLGQVISSFVLGVWSSILRRFKPAAQSASEGMVGITIVLAGSAAALLFAYFVSGRFVKIALAAACAIAAVVLSKQKPTTSTALLVLFAGCLGVAVALNATPALADDGGFAECGSSFQQWLTNCPGTINVLINALGGALPAGFTAAIGTYLGGLAGPGTTTTSRPPREPGTQTKERSPTPEEIKERLAELDSYTIYGERGQKLYEEQDKIRGKIKEQGGKATPEDLDRLRRLEEEFHAAAGDRHQQNVDEQTKFADKGMKDMVDRLKKEEDEWKSRQKKDEDARRLIEQIRDTARRHGYDDILDRADSASTIGPDGKMDSDYVDKLRDALKGRIGRDVAAPPEELNKSWVSDFATNTFNDARHNPWIRIGTGVLSGGSSEVIYQTQAAADAMQKAEAEAAAQGKGYDFTDGFRTGIGAVADENLPTNTIKAIKEGKITGITDLASNVGLDILAGKGLADDARNMANGVKGIRGIKGVDDAIPTRTTDVGDLVGPARTGEPRFPGEGAGKAIDGPAAQPKGPATRAPAGTTIDADGLKEFGLPENNMRHLNTVADRHLVNVELRPTNPDSIRLLNDGAHPKPETIKAKSITEADVLLGANPGDVGKIGYFTPKEPIRPADMPDNDWAKVQDRYQQRSTEFVDQSTKIQKMVDHGDIRVENGVILNNTTNKPYTGDHDLYRITSYDGSPVPDSIKTAVVNDLSGPPFQAQHGAHTDWKPQTTVDEGINTRIRNSHLEGGEALLEAGPGYRPPVTAYDKPVAVL